MAKKLDPHIQAILEKYHPNPKFALWDCHGTLVIYHKDVELMGAKAGVKLNPPDIIEADSSKRCVALCVTGILGDRTDWSIGEASPANNKNGYPYAMAEKRARGRVILKLLNLSGFIYTEEDAENFKIPESGELRMLKEMLFEVNTSVDLETFVKKNKPLIDELTDKEKLTFTEEYKIHRNSLKQKDAA